MQSSRSNQDRTEKTRAALIAAARALFVEKGYAETATPEIVAAAGITRGALYHHFRDKRDLFRAVAEGEARQVAMEIETAAAPAADLPVDALLAGSRAYLDAMAAPGRTRLLLIEAPSVLGLAETRALDEAHAVRTLREGLSDAGLAGAGADALGDLVSAAFDRAALAIDAGGDRPAYEAALAELIRRLVA
ncbi:TetR/AcrR family transcriptional regulator [Kaistia adipata]|uniref:TetR/AcrR family transcriptional regulator n=1 Tax=Kaistia adipata TaxID=166954 RepID=UPI0004249AF9|nr:TetR/AcrR family transcriptional regulator [Kaistia adipata]